MKKNFKNSLQYFQRLLGLNTECHDQLEEEKKFITYKTSPIENKKVGIEVTCRGEKLVLAPEQVMACFIRKTMKCFEKEGMYTKEIVLSVPTYASNVERQAYLDACEIAGVKCLRLLNESTAIAVSYGFFRKAEFEATKPRIVCFVDFGHSKLTVTYASFIPGKTKIIYSHSNRNIGARQIDYLLFDIFGKEFQKKYGCEPRQNVRCKLRLMDNIEKLRKLLSGNKEADINVDSLMEDQDFSKHVLRSDLEALMQTFIQNFSRCLKESLGRCGLPLNRIDTIELVGEATRIPIIQEAIKGVFGKKDLARTLNS